jgi:hypothetical protein
MNAMPTGLMRLRRGVRWEMREDDGIRTRDIQSHSLAL